MENKIIVKDAKPKRVFRTCSVCGCTQYINNYARHLKTNKHKQVDYANNQKFEITKPEPKKEKKNEFLILS